MARARVAILISGEGTNMAAMLYASKFDEAPFEIVLVASNNPSAAGLAIAAAEGVATFALSHAGLDRAGHDAAMHDAISAAGADYVVLAGYMRILSPEFVSKWAGHILNIHPSLLPLYPGLDTHRRAIDAGDSHGGCSVHLVTAELDSGPVLGQMRVAIWAGETSESLSARVKMAEHQLYPHVLASYIGRAHSADWLLSRIRAMALALPQTHERESHGTPGWRAGSEKTGKYFAYFSNQHHGSDAIGVLVKTSGMDELVGLCEDQPDVYWKPAYWGASGWIGIRLNRTDVDWDHISDWLDRSWRAIAPKKLTHIMGVADQF